MEMKHAHPLRIFWPSLLLTVVLSGVVAYHDGLAGLWLFIILIALELTFSFDNAIVNSKVLRTMSRFWQTIFLTVGIIVAVFVVRFLLPIVIVMAASGLGFGDVVHLALNDPERYGEVLHEASPMINAFGGAFLLMIGLNYFLDRHKETHWIRRIEPFLTRLGRFTGIKIIIMLLVTALLYLTVSDTYQTVVLVSSLAGIILHVTLTSLSSIFSRRAQSKLDSTAQKHYVQTGWAAFASFIYLEFLDASFSFDSVIGAFAITTSVLLIIAGLGVGAIWVRSLTVYLLRSGTLTRYRYLEHGAHWAILALGTMMMLKLYGIEPPEWVTGSLGLVFVLTALVTSILERSYARRRSKNSKA